MSGYTIMRKDPDAGSSYEPLYDSEGHILLFDNPDSAYQYYRKEHYWDTSDIQLVQFHEFKLNLIPEDRQ